MSKTSILASTTFLPDPSRGGVIATALRHLAKSAAAGITCIAPDGTASYISREHAERLAATGGEVKL